MRGLLLGVLLAVLAACAHAQSQSGAVSATANYGNAPSVTCPFGVDNGCAASTTFVAAPSVSDANAAFDAAQSGQIPTVTLTAYNALLHTANVNIPYVDYAIGSQAPNAYTAAQYISAFAGDSVCSAVKLPSPLGTDPQIGSGVPAGVPYILCQGTGVTGATSTSTSISGTALTVGGSITGTIKAGECLSGAGISTTPPFPCIVSGSGNNWTLNQSLSAIGPITVTYGPVENFTGWDFTNGGSASVIVVDKASGTAPGVSFTFQNDYLKANSFSAYCTAPGACGAAASYSTWSGSGSVVSALIFFLSSSGSNPAPALNLINDTCDGNFANAPDVASARLGCVQDNRSGSSAIPFQWPTTVLYSVFENFGHNPIQAASGGDVSIKYSANINTCMSASGTPGTSSPYCHGEWEEALGLGTTRNYVMVGNYTLRPSTNLNVAATTDFYLTSGAPNGVIVKSADVENNVDIWNYTNCTNAPVGGGLGGLGGYGPNNPCTPDSRAIHYGGGFLSFTYDEHVDSLTVSNNVFDNTASFYAYQSLSNLRTSLGLVANVTAPNTFTVTQQATGYQNGPSAFNEMLFPGQFIVDHNATGFVTTTISSFGTYTNTGTVATPCVIGTNAGCGSMTVANTEPTLDGTTSNFEFFPGMSNVTASGNVCIASGTAKAMTGMTSLPWGVNGGGAVTCP